jgi:hypothetical protein
MSTPEYEIKQSTALTNIIKSAIIISVKENGETDE